MATNALENFRLLGTALKRDIISTNYINHPKGSLAIIKSNKLFHYLKDTFGYLSSTRKYMIGFHHENDKLGKILLRFEPVFPWDGSELVRMTLKLFQKIKFPLNIILFFSKKLKTAGGIEYDDIAYPDPISWSDLPKLFLYVMHRLRVRKLQTDHIRINFYYEFQLGQNNSKISYDYSVNKLHVEEDAFYLNNNELKEVIQKLLFSLQSFEDLVVKDTKISLTTFDASHHAGTTCNLTNKNSNLKNSNIWVAGTSELECLYGCNPTFTALAQASKMVHNISNKK